MNQFTLKHGLAKRRRRALATAILLLALAGGLWWGLGPGPRLGQPELVEVTAGAGRWGIARQLAAANVVHSAVGFAAWSLLHRGRTLKAGTYQFPGGQSVATVFAVLAGGKFYALALVVPEGYNRFDIARELGQRGLADPAAFLQATADPSSVRDLDPSAVSLEGYLFPATYGISPHATAAHIAGMMTARFRLELRTALRGQLPPGGDLHRWVTMASLLEKESSLPAERRLIAGVFANRLARGLPLQCDPTVVYAALLAHRYDGTLHRADLNFASPYNTYRQPGLPPGPIANPGRAALLAAAQPTATDYLYFVSNGHGAHRFARTLAEQERNVALYVKGLRRHN